MNAFERERQIRALCAAIEACDDSTKRRLRFAKMAALTRSRSTRTVQRWKPCAACSRLRPPPLAEVDDVD